MACVAATVTLGPDPVAVGQAPAAVLQVSGVTTPVTIEGAVGIRGPQGLPGSQGPAGPSAIGGAPIAVADLTAGDLLQFMGADWRNTHPTRITDGGNF